MPSCSAVKDEREAQSGSAGGASGFGEKKGSENAVAERRVDPGPESSTDNSI